ncbi:hypothetical protein IT400_02975 [Candidatus Nomurabacteria bacterium]|nr:hypothetical protein [Candidatus Nomurabacteria bacterium]
MVANRTKLNHGGLNFLPLIIIGIIVFVFVRYDLKSIFESEQFNRNVNYIKGYFTTTIGKYSGEVEANFLKTNVKQNINKTSTFDFNSFFPQINNKIVNPNDTGDDATNTVAPNQREDSSEGYRTLP